MGLGWASHTEAACDGGWLAWVTLAAVELRDVLSNADEVAAYEAYGLALVELA